MNTFKKGDVVSVYGKGRHIVDYIDGPYVYHDKGGCSYHGDCKLVPQPKFGPGDVVSNGSSSGEFTIKCVKTSFQDGTPYNGEAAYDYADSYKGAWDYERHLTLVRRANPAPTLGDIVSDALKSRSGIKVGDRVRLDSPEYDDIPGTVTSIEWPHFKARWDGGGGDSVPFPIKYAVVISSAPGLETVFSEIRAGRVINAIKEYRAVYGVGLKEAKDSVEAIREAMNLAAPAPVSAPRDSIVVRFENGKYEPNSPPKVHPSLAEATAEAERLAKKEPGIAFATFSLMSHSTATKPTVSTVAK